MKKTISEIRIAGSGTLFPPEASKPEGLKNLLSQVRISILATLSLALILCVVYPLVVWGVSQALFPYRANGSLVVRKGTIVGSGLLSQGFRDPKYFHPRPSAAGQGYDAAASGGTNLGPLSRKLIETVDQRVKDYRAENNLSPETRVPADAVTSSGSGLDPHISIENAQNQAERIARVRGVSKNLILKKVEAHTDGRDLGILGEPGVNVLLLNLDLDTLP
jgi:potassium-transporting ATPase KdpC subunit